MARGARACASDPPCAGCCSGVINQCATQSNCFLACGTTNTAPPEADASVQRLFVAIREQLQLTDGLHPRNTNGRAAPSSNAGQRSQPDPEPVPHAGALHVATLSREEVVLQAPISGHISQGSRKVSGRPSSLRSQECLDRDRRKGANRRCREGTGRLAA